MATHIKDTNADQIVGATAEQTDDVLAEKIKTAAAEWLQRLGNAHNRINREELAQTLAEIQVYHVADDRTADEIIGYDEHGLPT